MAAKRPNSKKRTDAPKKLSDSIFYGFILDDEQEKFRDAIWDDEKLVVMCNAKAGTGKTLIAAATANLLVQYEKYERIIYIISPYAEHKQGYLKGSLLEKSEPYFEPFYNALTKIKVNPAAATTSETQRYETAYIDCRTDTFLRGVNFENAVVILDECQNYTFESLRTTITRCSDNVKLICIGHDRQCDLKDKTQSGFTKYIRRFGDIDDSRVAICSLTKNYRGWISSWADFDGE